MAVTINTNFYQEDEWKDLSKIVFTSPNMDSPANAGTRSHILPGQGALGLWYEDASYMYRIEPEQLVTQSDYYNYTMNVSTTVDLNTDPEYIEVNNLIDTFTDDLLQKVGVTPTGYVDNTARVTDTVVKLEYAPVHNDLSNISSDGEYATVSNVLSDYASYVESLHLYHGYTTRVVEKKQNGWYTEVLTAIPECYITFTFDYPIRVTKLDMAGITTSIATYTQYPLDSPEPGESDLVDTAYTHYFVGNYKLQSSPDGDTWSDIYTGAATNSITQQVYIDNTDHCSYYRIVILNNTGLVYADTDTDYYGISNLKFYGYTFSDNSLDENNVLIYKFDSLSDPEVIAVKNVSLLDSVSPTITTVTGTHTVAGTVSVTTVSGEEGYYSEYYVNLQETPEDYITNAKCTAATVSGIGTDIVDSGYSSTTRATVDNNVEADLEATLSYPIGTSVSFTSSGSITKDCSTASNICSADIEYVTVTSGTVIPGESIHTIAGYTDRIITTTSTGRSVGAKLWLSSESTCSGTFTEGDELSYWGHITSADYLDMELNNSVLFELTFGEAYDCRLSAWDDVTHSTTINELIAADHVRVSAVAYKCVTSKEAPGNGDNYVFPPSHNRIFKGNTSDAGYDYYYGDFNMVYRYEEDVFGDYLMFKPMLYGITDSLSYGIHDFVITLAYSYT